MKRNASLLFVLAMIISCNNDSFEFETFDKFPNETHLKHEVIETPPVLFSTVGIVLLDDVLITIDSKADKHFNVFQLPDYEYIGSYINRGRGPNEEIFIHSNISKINKNKFIYSSYFTHVKKAAFNKEENKIEILESFSLPTPLHEIQHAFWLDGKIYGRHRNESKNKEFVKFNPDDNTFSVFGPSFPELDENISLEKRRAFFSPGFTVKPDKTLIACTYNNLPILRIINTDGTLKRDMRFNNDLPFPHGLLRSNPSISDLDNKQHNYFDRSSTGKYIYALYWGVLEGERHGPDRRDGPFELDYSNEIHVWDWDGNPVKKIVLDRKIRSFDVTPDDKYLIGSSINSKDKLFKYPLQLNK